MAVEIATKEDLIELFENQSKQLQQQFAGGLQEINVKLSAHTEKKEDDALLWKRDIIERLGISPRTFDNVIVKLPWIKQSETLKRHKWYCRKSDLDNYIRENAAI